MRPRGSGELLESRRKRAMELLNQHLKPVEVARFLNVDRRSIRRWKASYLINGMEALKAHPPTGRPRKLNHEQRAELLKMLMNSPSHFGLKAEVWTCPAIVKVIRKKYGVTYHRNYIGSLIRSLGWNLWQVRAEKRPIKLGKQLSA